jgi:hypothetical protein
MRSRRNLKALLDEFLGPFRAYRLYAGNCVLVATGCGRGWGDSEGIRHLIEIGSDLVPTSGLRIELYIRHYLFDLAGSAQHGGDGISLPGLLKFVQYRGCLLFESGRQIHGVFGLAGLANRALLNCRIEARAKRLGVRFQITHHCFEVFVAETVGSRGRALGDDKLRKHKNAEGYDSDEGRTSIGEHGFLLMICRSFQGGENAGL